MDTAPTIDLILSPFDKFLEGMGKLLLLLMVALTVYTLIKSPANVPTHFNATGHADSYGNKATIVILPVLGIIIYLVITLLSKHPGLFNYNTKLTAENAQQQYTIVIRMVRLIKLAVLVLFILIIFFTYLTSIGVANGLGAWLLPLTLFLFLAPNIFLIIQSLKSANKKP